jgi:hypothetical protein
MEVGGVEVTTDGPEVLDELGITEAVDAHPDVSSASRMVSPKISATQISPDRSGWS